MRSFFLTSIAFLICLYGSSQNSPSGNIDPHEIRFATAKPYELLHQQTLRTMSAWQNFMNQNGSWYVHFDEASGMPHRAYGSPLEISGNALEEKALNFAMQKLSAFQIPTTDLHSFGAIAKGKYSYVNFRQYYQNLEVIGSRYMVKFYGSQVVAFGCDVHSAIDINVVPEISIASAKSNAASGIGNNIVSIQADEQNFILPIVVNGVYEYRLVFKILVKTIAGVNVPANYETLVDAHTGEVLSRINTVLHSHVEGTPGKPCKPGCAHESAVVVTANVVGQVYENNPYETAVTMGMENIYITSANVDYQADENGDVVLPVNPSSSATIALQGPWSRVATAGIMPSMNVTLLDGQNNFSINSISNIKERTAYRSVQKIHDFMKLWMPADFSGMDFQLPTNIDEAGDCNAFYDGASINFFDIGNGCNASSLVADVCFHEYGHGINDNYYQSLGGSFDNGAMGEGYADFWAVSCNNNPQLGIGFYTANMDPLRRYDLEPRVFPSDISGEVHNDGEIIMGAWWDTHLLLGSDWNVTMPLFIETYAGMQAEASNGNEGIAYTDVLIDLLQADDNDGDITNGTPHGNEIVDAFYIHGITLISNAELSHTPILFANTPDPISFETTLDLQFPFTQYLQSVNCFYKINNGNWVTLQMVEETSNDYSAEISSQPAGTVIAYYFGTYDINGSISAVIPIGAQLTPANLPYYRLIGLEEIGVQDSDNNEFFGSWQLGITNDNATTGEWVEDSPIGSYSADPVTIVQTDAQHTLNGEFCFITGNANSSTAAVGTNDVDDGKTTLQTPSMNLTSYVDPVISYWRWYTNSPVSGANPGQDYWQVRISNNNGNTWTYVENTKVSDASWRRNAFRVSDYVTPTAQVKMQFIASDSTHIGQNLDGGSLVEAALDDFILYDAIVTGVNEINISENSISIYPNPARDQISIRVNNRQGGVAEIQLINSTGQLAFSTQLKTSPGLRNYSLELPEMAEGIYTVKYISDEFFSDKKIYIAK